MILNEILLSSIKPVQQQTSSYLPRRMKMSEMFVERHILFLKLQLGTLQVSLQMRQKEKVAPFVLSSYIQGAQTKKGSLFLSPCSCLNNKKTQKRARENGFKF